MKTLSLIILMLLGLKAGSVYDFKLKSIDGAKLELAQYRGKKMLIVNTASKCGFTPQYADLQKLADEYKDKVVVIGFPANNFGGQEPGSNSHIQEFCERNYGVNFPLSEKLSVRGKDIAPLFKYLTNAANPDFTGDIKWNFEKFLIDENGKLIHRFRSNVKPLSEEITKYL